MFRKLIFGLLVIIMCSCDTFTGCGTVVDIGLPQPQYYYYVNNEQIRVGRYNYPITVRGEDGKNHKVYVSYYTWENAQKGDIICLE